MEQRRAANTRSVRLRVTIISLNRPYVTSGSVVPASFTRESVAVKNNGKGISSEGSCASLERALSLIPAAVAWITFVNLAVVAWITFVIQVKPFIQVSFFFLSSCFFFLFASLRMAQVKRGINFIANEDPVPRLRLN